MIKSLNDQFFYQIRELLSVNHIAGFWVYLSSHFDMKVIVMAVVVGQIAFAKNLLVSSLIPLRVVQAMGCVKMFLSENGDFHVKSEGDTVIGTATT